jgi:predicted SprT family Zn-dependent metalloprotease
MATPKATPTRAQFQAYEQMFAYFNARLFAGELPPVLLNFSRHVRSYGFFAPERWERGQAVRHEISLNPSTLKSRAAIDVASTLVHEMVHLWQHEKGTPSRAGYHNQEWAAKMDAVGLVPSSTGEPGGARTGQQMTHYIDKAGAFAEAFRAMPREYGLPWTCEEPDDRAAKKKRAAKNKVKYSCPSCDANVWGRPDLAISCDDCGERFEEVA